MSTQHGKLFPVYVWEVPVRIWHWVMAGAMVVLAVTGYLIGTPPPSIGGEGYDHFMFGYIRFAHFAAAYLFAVTLLLRILWVFVGNRFAREIFLVPLKLFSAEWWGGLISQTKYYLFLKREARPWQGHNPLAMAAMFFMYLLGTLFMIVTGMDEEEVRRIVFESLSNSSPGFPLMTDLLRRASSVIIRRDHRTDP